MRKICSHFVFLLLIFISNFSFSQHITFEKYYDFGLTNAEEGYCVQQTTDGGYIVAGRHTIGIGSEQMLLQKVDSTGLTQWYKFYGGPGDSEAHSVQQTTDGGYIMVGNTPGVISMYSIYLVKTNSNGDTLWTKIFAGENKPNYSDDAYSVRQTFDGGYAIAGEFNNDSTDVGYLLKTNANGDSIWSKQFIGFVGGAFYSMQELPDSGFIMAGVIAQYTSGNNSFIFLVRTDKNGDSLWTKKIGKPTLSPGANSVSTTTDGGYIIVGTTDSLQQKLYLIKTNSSGDTLWTKTYSGTGNDVGEGVQQTSDGGYIITGATTSYGGSSGTEYLYLLKTNSSGNFEWRKTFGGTWGASLGDCIQVTSDGGFIISGFTSSYGNLDGDVFLIKTDSAGNVLTSVNEINHYGPLFLICPNPFKEQTNIFLSNRIFGIQDLQLSITDVLGKEVRREIIPNGDDVITIHRNLLPAGMFFVQIFSGTELLACSKIIIQ